MRTGHRALTGRLTATASLMALIVASLFLAAVPFPAPSSAGVSGLVKDSGFEEQHTRAVGAPWGFEGIDPKGMDIGLGLENTGRNNAWIRSGSRQWNAITQVVTVRPNTAYSLSAWVRTSGNFDGGYFGVRSGASRAILNEVRFGAAAANPAAYQYLSVEFSSGADTTVTVFIGYWAPGADSWLQIDDVDLGGPYSNWAGYAYLSGPRNAAPVRQVAATWVQPTVRCGQPSTESVGLWVGLGGYNTSDQESLVQIGTAATCLTREYPSTIYPEHQAFWEVIDSGTDTHQQNLNLPLAPGDLITAVITTNPLDLHQYVLFIANDTRHWSRTLVKNAPRNRNLSAEVIMEKPAVSGRTATWPDDINVRFRDVRFDGKPPSSVALRPVVAINDRGNRQYGPTSVTGAPEDGFSIRSSTPLPRYPSGPFVRPGLADAIGPLIRRP